MNGRPSAEQFAQWSLYLAYATSAIMGLALLVSWAGTPFGSIVWFAFLTSAAGAFMGWIARRDLKGKTDAQNAMLMARRGWRTNIIAFGVLVVLMVGVFLFSAFASQQLLQPFADPTPTPLALSIGV